MSDNGVVTLFNLFDVTPGTSSAEAFLATVVLLYLFLAPLVVNTKHLFRDPAVLVSISMDLGREFHDKYRVRVTIFDRLRQIRQTDKAASSLPLQARAYKTLENKTKQKDVPES